MEGFKRPFGIHDKLIYMWISGTTTMKLDRRRRCFALRNVAYKELLFETEFSLQCYSVMRRETGGADFPEYQSTDAHIHELSS